MKKYSWSIISLLILFSHFNLYASSHHHDHYDHYDHHDHYDLETQNIGELEEELPIENPIRLLYLDGELKIDVYLRNFGYWDQVKLESAATILLEVMNSELFKQAVLNHAYQDELQFHENKGMSNLEIYDLLMTGAEVLLPEIDHTMNFDLTLYRSMNPWSKVKGYTKPDTMRIWLNTKFYRKISWTPVDVAANMAHEWVHKMGFGHSYYNTPERPFTVPYGIGNIVKKVALELGLEDTSL